MQEQHHINANEEELARGRWARCTASIRGDQVVCELDYSRVYDLADAYIHSPHATFVNLKTEPELIDFLREFGPIWQMAESALRYYWSFQNRLRALLKLLKAFTHRRVQYLMGHKSIITTMRYAHLEPERQCDAVERLVSVTSTSISTTCLQQVKSVEPDAA
jgi:hypothetical protein